MLKPCTFPLPTLNALSITPYCEDPSGATDPLMVAQLAPTDPSLCAATVNPVTEKIRSHPLFCSPLELTSRRCINIRTYTAHRTSPADQAREVIAALSFGQELFGDLPAQVGPIMTLHRFLRGDLAAEPSYDQVQELCLKLWHYVYSHPSASKLGWTILEPDGIKQPIYQIYTQELLDQLAAYIEELSQQLPNPPRIVEIAAGDGRLSRALRRRGIAITATDSQRPGEWPIAYPDDVKRMDGATATRQTDIILASWLPLVDAEAMEGITPMDARVAQELLQDDSKTLILIGAASRIARTRICNSDAFERLTDDRFQLKFPDELNFTSRYDRLPQSRTRFPGFLAGNDHRDDWSKVVVYRAKTGRSLPGTNRPLFEIETIRYNLSRGDQTQNNVQSREPEAPDPFSRRHRLILREE